MTDPWELADTYHRYRQATDHQRLLWIGDLDQIEHWEDVSTEALDVRSAELRDFADEADALLSEERAERSLLETIAFTARSAANQLKWRNELSFTNPAIGIVSDILTFLPRYQLVTSDHGERYHRKLSNLPAFLDQVSSQVSDSSARGIVALERHLVGSVASIDRYLAGDHDALLAQSPPSELTDAAKTTWQAETDRLIRSSARPALGRFRDVLAEVSGDGKPDDQPGLSHLEGGAELYRDLIWSHTSLELTGPEVHEIGLEQVARLEEEYRTIAGGILGTTDIGEIYRTLREDPALSYTDGQSLIDDAVRALERAASVAPDWFGTLPQSRCTAEEIQHGGLAFYSKPIPEVGKPGTFFFNTSTPSAWKKFQLEAVTYHESIPGHHLQLALVTESDHIHGVHTDLPVTVYAEGWGLYTERLADEMGLYSSDLDRVGMLSADSMRACRLVTDTGIHAMGWSRDQAIDYVLANSPLTRSIAEGEIDRYIGMPGQALSYMIGRLEIDRIRSEAESRPSFDIREFHDSVLGHGMVPLATLRRLVLG